MSYMYQNNFTKYFLSLFSSLLPFFSTRHAATQRNRPFHVIASKRRWMQAALASSLVQHL